MGNDCKQDRPTAYNLHYQETFFVFAKRRFYAGLLTFSFILAGLTNVQAASPTGRWSGGWYSQSTGHKGPLKAKIRQTQPGTYQAVFFGRFAKVIPFVYPAKLERVPGTCNCYTSSQRLPLLGTYKMSATVTDHRFYATFGGRKDAGTFDMSR